MKTLYSLGDSFMTTDDPDEGIVGFCELYCCEKNFKHVSLARPGATNFAIRLQIDRAVNDRADFVVIGLTCSERFDIALDTKESAPLYTLENIFYRGYRARSEQHVNQTAVKLISDTFSDIFLGRPNHKDLISDQHLQALKSYLAYLHNPALSIQKEYYMMSDGIRKLQMANIPFVLIPGLMGHLDWSWVHTTWPEHTVGPYHLPYGPSDWERPPRFTNTHNPAWAHEEFCQTLLKITQDWH